MPAIEIKNFTFTYPGAKAPALCDVDLAIEQGEFVLLCGETGSGKTTLLRSIKKEIAPTGDASGCITRLAAADAGYVAQDPETQVVMDSVWHELAFGPENLGLEPGVIRRRMAETANFFGIEPWIDKRVCELSGGQKQILALAGAMMTRPNILLLDEPTAQLDPIAAKEFLHLLARVHDELGMTIVISEHRLSDLMPIASRILMMRGGRIVIDAPPREFAEKVYDSQPQFAPALPYTVRLARECGMRDDYPLSVREGRERLSGVVRPTRPAKEIAHGDKVISAGEVWYRYNRDDEFVLRSASVSFERGEIHCILGGNGSGKSTLLRLLGGAYKPTRGAIKRNRDMRTGMLPQDPKALMVCDTLEEELRELSGSFGYGEAEINAVCERLSLSRLTDRHPFDLSGGEQQKAALAKLLLLRPDIILLDEPTKGIDRTVCADVEDILRERAEDGCTVIAVTHDIDFAARIADRCSMLFSGSIVCTDTADRFFAENVFYTTEEERIFS